MGPGCRLALVQVFECGRDKQFVLQDEIGKIISMAGQGFRADWAKVSTVPFS